MGREPLVLRDEESTWSDEHRRRAWVLVASALVFLAAVVVQSLINLARGYYLGVVQFVPFVATVFLALWLVRRHGRVVAALNVFSLVFSLNLVALIAFRRGLGATPPMAALFLTPLLAMIVAGARSGAIWMAIVAAEVVGLVVAGRAGLVVSDQVPLAMREAGDTWMMLLVGTLVFALAWAFHASRTRALDAVVEREAKLREAENERMAALQRVHTVEAERLAAMGRLAAATAHEVNNPLSYVINNLEHLIDEAPAIPEPLRAPLDDALQGAHRVRAIMRGLRTFTRTDAELDVVDLACAMNAAIELTRPELRPRAAVHVDLADLPPAWGNEVAIVQVFTNLLLNAAHALPEGRSRDFPIDVTGFEEDGFCTVVLRDHGPGIPPDVAERIFEPFFTTKPIGKGTGLGLAVCRNIVTGLGGTITHAPAEPGARFVVRLPRATEEHRASVSSRSPSRPRRSIPRARILIVDDELLVARALARGLGEHHVTIVNSGAEALELIAGDAVFDVVLCDLMMPDLTGMDVHQALEREAPELARRMIFMSGGVFTPRAEAFRAEIGNRFLGKPLDLDEVSDLVCSQLEPPRAVL